MIAKNTVFTLPLRQTQWRKDTLQQDKTINVTELGNMGVLKFFIVSEDSQADS